jgi:hypothetical protein
VPDDLELQPGKLGSHGVDDPRRRLPRRVGDHVELDGIGH